MENLLDMLYTVEFTHNYIFTVDVNGTMYACIYANASDALRTVGELVTYNKVTRIRVKPTRANKNYLYANADEIVELESKKEFEKHAKTYRNRYRLNRGYYNEVIVAKRMGGRLVGRKNAPLNKSGDMICGGVHYQLKLYNATVCHEDRLINMLKGKI